MIQKYQIEKMAKVSIIVPVYNVENYIDRCLNSLINQTLKDIEIILVDDKSEDSSPLICDNYAKKDKRIKVIHKSQNEGLGFARNSGIEIANGEYIAFLDSDDYVDIDFYENLYNNNEGADIVYGASKDEYNGVTKSVGKCQLEKRVYENEEIIPNILYNMIGNVNKNLVIGFTTCMEIYKSSIIKENNIRFYSERQFSSEDCLFNFDVIPKCKKIKFIDNTFFHYCHRENSLTTQYNEKRFEKAEIMYNELVKRTKELNIYEDVEKGINFFLLSSVRICIKQEKLNEKEVAIKNIRKICENKLVQNVLLKPCNKTIRQKIFDYFIKCKMVKTLYFIIKNK